MKRLINTSILFLIIYNTLSAQFGISLKVGYGGYKMEDIKDYQNAAADYFLETYDINLETLENIPNNYYYSLEAYSQSKKDFRFSLGYSYFTTGSRIYYEDYSGFLKNDIIISANSFRVGLSQEVIKSIVNIGLYFNPQIYFNKTDLKLSLNLEPDYDEEEIFKMKSSNFGAETGIFIRKPINHFELYFETGYYFELSKSELAEKNEFGGSHYLYLPKSRNKVKNNWSGFRISLGFGYNF